MQNWALSKKIEVVLGLSFVLLALIVINPLYNFLINLLKSFSVQIMAALGIIGLLLIIFRRWLLASQAIIAASLILFHLLPHVGLDFDKIKTSGGNILKVAHFNVFIDNRSFEHTLNTVKDLDPDFISFQEVNSGWAKELVAGLKKDFPYYKVIPCDSTSYGIAYFSKHPVLNSKVIYFTEKPNLTGDISINNEKIHFISSHTKSPLSRKRYHERNEHIRNIVAYIKEKQGPVLAIGDYNAVPWHPHIIDLKNETGLKDSRKSLTPTFPSHVKLARIPIDYIFYSEDIRCLDFKAVKSTKSDHFGVVGEYRF
jgi:endonuclease/exonuclease/phosphatase (EEP) superfamily protein YafD